MDNPHRLWSLRDLALLATAPEPEYDDLVRVTARLCGTASAALTLVDGERTWVKACFGAVMPEVAHGVSLYAQAIAGSGLFVLEDARLDTRWRDTLLVKEAPHIAFYACMPLVLEGGERVGLLEIFDSVSRHLDAEAADLLRLQARQAVCLLQARLDRRRYQETSQRLEELQAVSHVGTRALELASQRLRLACRLGRLSAWDFDVLQQALHWDEELFHIFGFDVHQQPDVAQVFEHFAPPDRELLRAAFESCCRDAQPYDLVLRMTNTRGEALWTRSIGEAVRDAEGRVVRVQGAFQDITQQVHAVEERNRVGRQLEATLERMSDGFYLLDRDWRMLYFNAAAEQVLAKPRAAVLGRRVWEVFAGIVGSELERTYRDVMASGRTARLEYHYLRQDRWYDVTAYPSDEGMAVYFRDITERRAEIETWRLLAEAMPLIVWTARTDGQVDYVSPALSCYAGLPGERLLSEGFDALVHMQDRACARDAWNRAVQTGQPLEVEMRLRRADGVYRWHLARAVLVSTEKCGTRKWYGSSIDIDDNKRLEQSARALARRLESTMESITDGIFALDREWRFTLLNRQAEVMLKRPRDELLGRNIWREFPQAAGSEFQRQYEQCLASGRIVRFEEPFAPLGAHFEITAYPAEEGLTVFFRDVTQLKQAQSDRAAREAAEQANQAKSRFLTHISHELRTPLNAIMGFAQLMQLDAQTPLAPNHVEWVRKIHAAGEHLLAMISEMLDLARIEARGIELRLELLDIHAVATASLDVMEPQAAAAGVLLTNDVPIGLPAVQADALRLRQVLLNLVSNAVKYNRRGGWVRVSAQVVGDRMRLDVEDTGQGLSDEQLEQLFQPFKRLGAERSKVEGTGIGLVIARRLAQLMHGDLRAARGAAGGSVFTLELPIGEAAADPDQSPTG